MQTCGISGISALKFFESKSNIVQKKSGDSKHFSLKISQL